DPFQDPHRLQHDNGTSAVVRRTSAHVPGVEVPAEHHNFAALVRPWNLPYSVVGHQLVLPKTVLDVELQNNRYAVLHVAVDEGEVFIGKPDVWRCLRLSWRDEGTDHIPHNARAADDAERSRSPSLVGGGASQNAQRAVPP